MVGLSDGLLYKLKCLLFTYHQIHQSLLSENYFTVSQGSSNSDYFPISASEVSFETFQVKPAF